MARLLCLRAAETCGQDLIFLMPKKSGAGVQVFLGMSPPNKKQEDTGC
jgi:hypothetical protein